MPRLLPFLLRCHCVRHAQLVVGMHWGLICSVPLRLPLGLSSTTPLCTCHRWFCHGDGIKGGLYYRAAEAQFATLAQVCARRALQAWGRAPRALLHWLYCSAVPPTHAGCRRTLAAQSMSPSFLCPAALALAHDCTQYYDMPSPSVRDAAWPLMQAGIPPFKVRVRRHTRRSRRQLPTPSKCLNHARAWKP